MPIVRGLDVQFPFEPYECQRVYMEHVIGSLQTGRNALLESPTGTGKTLCLLCATLAWREAVGEVVVAARRGLDARELRQAVGAEVADRAVAANAAPVIIYASRTHSQLTQVVKELKNSAYRPRISLLGSREQLCVHPEVSRLRGAAQNHKCQALGALRQCHYKNNVEGFHQAAAADGSAGDILDIEELGKLGREREVCPFYLTRESQGSADMVFIPYNYLIDPKVRSSVKVNWRDAVLIFDEAHNVDSVACDAASFDVSAGDLAGCVDEVSAVLTQVHGGQSNSGLSVDDLAKCKALLLQLDARLQALPAGKTHPGAFLFEWLAGVNITYETVGVLLEMLGRVQQALQDGGATQKLRLEALITAMERVFRSADWEATASSYRVHVHDVAPPRGGGSAGFTGGGAGGGGRTISFWCFHPGVAMGELQRLGVHCVVLTSGTLSPLDAFAAEMGLEFPVRLANPHVVDARQVCVRVLRSGPTGRRLNSSYHHRDTPDYKNELGRTLLNLARLVPRGLLVFFPSYATMDRCVDWWRQHGTWAQLAERKELVVEPRGQAAFAEAVQAFHAAVRDHPSGAALFAVCRGKGAEGIDFADDAGRCVVVTGLPLPPFKDPKVELKRQFLDAARPRRLSGSDWYQQQATRAVNQAIGRVIRHRRDFGAIILADERFASARERGGLSQWLQPFVKVCERFQEVPGGLTRFYRGMSASASASAGVGGGSGSGSAGGSGGGSGGAARASGSAFEIAGAGAGAGPPAARPRLPAPAAPPVPPPARQPPAPAPAVAKPETAQVIIHRRPRRQADLRSVYARAPEPVKAAPPSPQRPAPAPPLTQVPARVGLAQTLAARRAAAGEALAAAAAAAPPITPTPRTKAAKRRRDPEAARGYLALVRAAITGDEYLEFKRLLGAFRSAKTDVPELIHDTVALLRPHPALLTGFRDFVPKAHRARYDESVAAAAGSGSGSSSSAPAPAPAPASAGSTSSAELLSQDLVTGQRLPRSKRPKVRLPEPEPTAAVQSRVTALEREAAEAGAASAVEVVKCPICLSAPTAPYTAPCGHVCCYTCWQQWLGQKMECPECRKPVRRSALQSLLRFTR